MRTVEWYNNTVRLIDQRLLPHCLEVIEYGDYREVARAIGDMVVRGAPAIGVTAAMGMALAGLQSQAGDKAGLLVDLEQAAAELGAARPTAVNLGWGLRRLLELAARPDLDSAAAVRAALVAEAQAMADEDVAINQRMGAHGAALVRDGDTLLHHCNTGGLAAVDYGTALGVIRCAHEQGKHVHVLVDETRPRLQGARLTAWELQAWGIPFTLIADNAAGHFLRTGRVNMVLFGADRIAANGDVANKIGTYKLAVVARENGVPVYCVAPTSTVDLALPNGDTIPIEERDPREVTHIGDTPIAPEGCPAANPAFDVTPARYITGIVTENGLAYPPFDLSLRRLSTRRLSTSAVEGTSHA
ncbi:MAG: S-methyl-5-thioribose-1-phosphate isomerase [Thermoflexales bacterium]|nr:S-methyl-5-thioribose-1-phosphate isomerase [Thermoflexales bacterium]